MTQTNTPSVRSDAEAAINTNTIPTFEEVYAMPYVQESLQSILDQNIRQYPLLASYKDDLRQEMLIGLNAALPQFDGRAGIETFCRTCLENSMKNARRRYYQHRNLIVSYAKDISDFENVDDDVDLTAEDCSAYVAACERSFVKKERMDDVMKIIAGLPPHLKNIVERVLDGESIRDIERDMNTRHSTFRYKYLRPIRLALGRKFS